MKNPKVSIIIRTKNEERWIATCLRAMKEQSFKDYEIIILDNESTDGTVKKAKQFPVQLISITDYKPGKALNEGIKHSKGELIVFISGHCIPTNHYWLEKLIDGFNEDDIAGVYGRQQPMNFSSPETKRDLLIVFGLDRRIQTKDTFFHNANSAIRRDIWEKFPFDETATNIEDRLWASVVMKEGYKILYEPESSVYHHHGIHHDGKPSRIKSTIKVIESFAGRLIDYSPGNRDRNDLKISAFIPVRGTGPVIKGEPLLKYTLKQVSEAKTLDKAFLLTDSVECAEYARKFDIITPFIRESYYSKEFIDLSTVYQYCLHKVEESGYHPDLIVLLEPTFPFRPPGLIDKMVNEVNILGYDTMLPAFEDYSPHWQLENGVYSRLDTGDVPRHLKDPIFKGLTGICTVTHSEYVRKGTPIGDYVGIVKLDSPLAGIEIRESSDNYAKLLELFAGPE